jgi:release factor glutamine methyltransferase
LQPVGLDTPGLDAEILLAHVLGTSREYLRTYPEAPISRRDCQRYRALVTRRARRVPVAYLIGSKEFYGHRLIVTPAVLIPRPETESLVEQALAYLRAHRGVRRVIDLGTGSGAIAIALACALRRLRVDAIDVDARALAVARRNLMHFGLRSRVRLRHANLLEGAARVACIVANLPYLSAERRRQVARDVRYEPRRALNGGPDGLALIRETVGQAAHTLRRPGCLLLECDPAQAAAIRRLALRTFPEARVDVVKDLSGRARVMQVTVS